MEPFKHVITGMVAMLAAACGAPPPPSGEQPPAAAARAATGSDATPRSFAGNATGATRQASDDPGHYTSLAAGDCEIVEVYEEVGGSTSRCGGPGGYQLLVQDVDARMSLDVVAPGGATTGLRLVTAVGRGAFSDLGPRAEWRFGVDGNPDALIVRFNAYLDPEQPSRPTSYLVVTRLAAGDTCPVAAVEPGPMQNLEARRIADEVAGRPCLQVPGG